MLATAMLATVGTVGFIALLALIAAGMLCWLSMRLTCRVTFLERQTLDLAGACRILHQKIDSIPPAPAMLALGAGPVGAPFPGGVSLDTGMNLSKRVQILRLNRRGESSTHIASVLNIPLAQVELVLKLQRQMDEVGLAPRT